MGHAAGQYAETLQLRRLQKLLLEALAFGNIACNMGCAGNMAFSISDGRNGERDIDPRPILMDPDGLAGRDPLATAQLFHHGP